MTIQNPIVSVVMPVYNTDETYFRTAIENILQQSYTAFELVVVNDATTSYDVEAVVKSYADERISYVAHKQNSGLSASRNSGTKVAKGKYLTYVDSDDWLSVDALENILAAMVKDESDILFFRVENVDERTQERSVFDDFSTLPQSFQEKVLGFDDYMSSLFVINSTAWAKLFRKDFLIENNLQFTEGLTFEDTEFFFRYMMLKPRLSFCNNAVYFYRRNVSSSIVMSGNEKFFDVIKVYNSIENSLRKAKIFEDLQQEFYKNKLWSLNFRFDNIRKDLKAHFKKLIQNDLQKDGAIESFLSAESMDYYQKFMCPYYRQLCLLQKFLSYIFCIKNKNGYKIIKILGISFKKHIREKSYD